MPASLGSLTETLQKLIHKFEANKIHYLSKSYLEAQVRVDLISPFFKALGWDMENEAGLSQHDREAGSHGTVWLPWLVDVRDLQKPTA